MGRIVWGLEPELFGPRHAHREGRLLRALGRLPGDGLHLECAAGVGSLSIAIAGTGTTVVACDRSLRSLAVLRDRAQAGAGGGTVLPVVADITALPFADQSFTSASSAETLEHVEHDQAAVSELARVLAPGGILTGTVPATGGRWQEWDTWAGHRRRYSVTSMSALLRSVGLVPRVTRWGWPLLRLYDTFFLRRLNRHRLRSRAPAADDRTLQMVSGISRLRWLVRLVRACFELDRLWDGAPWGVGLLFRGRRPTEAADQAGASGDASNG